MRFLPKDESFFDHFEKQGKKTVEGCHALLAMVTTPGDLVAQAKVISDIEGECDQITHAVVEQLHKTFITPLDRNDIYRLITKMDDVMDYVEAASERIALYELTEITKETRPLCRVIVASGKRLAARTRSGPAGQASLPSCSGPPSCWG